MEKNMLQIICQTCKGNGYIKHNGLYEETVIQCPKCKSEGEIKVDDSQVAKIGNAFNGSKYHRCPHN